MSYLEVREVSKSIGSERILDSVSFSADSGEVVCLEGENGSGKTMAMRVVCGLVRPDSGYVEIAGKRLWEGASFPPSVGLLIETPALLDNYSAMDNLSLLASIRGVASAEQLRYAIERVGLGQCGAKPVRKFSLGMRQRLGIAMAIMEEPDLLVLDEPTNALDEEGVSLLVRIINEERMRGATLLVSSHDGDFVGAVATRVYRMSYGRVKGEEEGGAR
ncbi:ATP-binding cassette domain-containing protein [Olsenella sp. AM30-3LB]|uniref:ABC transporter ATP-binding protein n=1 Tax=Olsenella sp. AM30-3LB TaxID=2292359 RepID=UPI000E546473|nr:ATP-binding cassette domain-containing protein [Olsenella sp. AM30-3LB]RHD74850.1 ATP-binding cassette domain-containing protein [Olsenella sp. AM30-3LB]